ncbi:MAG: hypothetical protein KGY76_04015 [Candidatus Thermoplasmatota archaeon]|nr:hypothetical protein [Candidatus Thermoplasmatota archaeon]
MKYRHCGSRKIEASLLNNGFSSEDVVIGHPDHLDKLVGPNMELLDDLSDKDFLIVPLMFVPFEVSKEEDFFSREDVQSEHWQLLARCIRKDLEVAPKLINDLSRMDDFNPVVTFGYHLLRKYMEIRMEPYLKEMERGHDPV